jgi:hypothetical protein
MESGTVLSFTRPLTVGGGYRKVWLAFALQAVAILSATAWGQQATPDDAQRPMQNSGIRLDSITSYAAGYSLLYPQLAASQAPGSVGLYELGTGAAVSWSVVGRRTELSARYSADGVYTERFADLRTVNQSFVLDVNRDRDRRTSFYFHVSAESRLISSVIFDQSNLLNTAQVGSASGQPSDSITGDVASEVTSSPVGLLLLGERRLMGAAAVGLTHRISRRSTIQSRVGIVRDQRSDSQRAAALASQPSVTMGIADMDVSYSVSQRTRIIASSSYRRSNSLQYRYNYESASAGLDCTLGRGSFGRFESGYAWSTALGSGTPASRGYTTSVALGTTKGDQTLIATARRDVADFYGLNANGTLEFGVAWSWRRPNSSWVLGTGFSYQRLRMRNSGILEAWLYNGSITRQLGAYSRIVLDLAWADGLSSSASDFTRRGIRASYIFVPKQRSRLP